METTASAAAKSVDAAAAQRQRDLDTLARVVAERDALQARLGAVDAELRQAVAQCEELASYQRLYREQQQRDAVATDLIAVLQGRLQAAEAELQRGRERLAKMKGARADPVMQGHRAVPPLALTLTSLFGRGRLCCHWRPAAGMLCASPCTDL